jgi:hypothetical protein
MVESAYLMIKARNAGIGELAAGQIAVFMRRVTRDFFIVEIEDDRSRMGAAQDLHYPVAQTGIPAAE